MVINIAQCSYVPILTREVVGPKTWPISNKWGEKGFGAASSLQRYFFSTNHPVNSLGVIQSKRMGSKLSFSPLVVGLLLQSCQEWSQTLLQMSIGALEWTHLTFKTWKNSSYHVHETSKCPPMWEKSSNLNAQHTNLPTILPSRL